MGLSRRSFIKALAAGAITVTIPKVSGSACQQTRSEIEIIINEYDYGHALSISAGMKGQLSGREFRNAILNLGWREQKKSDKAIELLARHSAARLNRWMKTVLELSNYSVHPDDIEKAIRLGGYA